jgi:undecaprenyl-diphosphatase
MGAGAYDLFKQRDLLSAGDAGWFAVGTVVAFVSALACVRWLLRFVSSHDFTWFAGYRVIFGLLVLLTNYTGLIDWSEE